MESRKMNALSLEEKYELIQYYERDKITAKELTNKFNCGKTQVYDTLKNREKIKIKYAKSTCGPDCASSFVVVSKVIEKLSDSVYEWLIQAQSRGIDVTVPLLRNQAKIVADDLRWERFKPTNSWLRNFKKKYGVTFNQDHSVELVTSDNCDLPESSNFSDDANDILLAVPKIEKVVSLVDCETLLYTPEDLPSGGLSTDGRSPREANHCLRIQLAAAHRALAEYGVNDATFNHLSVMAPAANGEGEVMLITPFPMQFSQVTPSNIIGVNIEGEVVEGGSSASNPSFAFHRGLYITDPTKRCLMRTHSTYVSVLACLQECKFKILEQTSAILLRAIAYVDRCGSMDTQDDGMRLGTLLGPNHKAMLIRHHGSLSADQTVYQAFNRMIAMEGAAKLQVLAMQTNQKLNEIESPRLEKVIEQMETFQSSPLAEAQLKAVIDRLAKTEFEFQYE